MTRLGRYVPARRQIMLRWAAVLFCTRRVAGTRDSTPFFVHSSGQRERIYTRAAFRLRSSCDDGLRRRQNCDILSLIRIWIMAGPGTAQKRLGIARSPRTSLPSRPKPSLVYATAPRTASGSLTLHPAPASVFKAQIKRGKVCLTSGGQNIIVINKRSSIN